VWLHRQDVLSIVDIGKLAFQDRHPGGDVPGKVKRSGSSVVVFEWIIGLLLAAVALAALARRVKAPYPVFLALGGAALAIVPDVPNWTLDPSLALALFIAPVLLDAAYDTSLRDLKANWVPVAGLVVAAVLLTTLLVAVVVRLMVPTLPIGAAIALGAILAPPDAAAATAVVRQLRLPHRLVTILEGESLLNDASALLIYRLAVGAVAAGGFSPVDVAPAFLLAVAGSIVAGPLLAFVFTRIIGAVEDAPSAIILQFALTFAVWIIAEQLGLSGILTIVTYAVTVARSAPARTPARLRVPSYAVWETATFILNVLGFVFIGLQLGPIWGRLAPQLRLEYAIVAGVILVTVILARFLWMLVYFALKKVWSAMKKGKAPTLRSGLVIAWCGMRGIVSLAAAFALPEGFPGRDLILVCAFSVVVGTLLIQGLTLRPLLQRLGLDDGDPVGREVGRARAIAYRAALEAVDGDRSAEGEALRQEYGGLLAEAERDPQGGVRSELPADPLRRRAIDAARRAVLDLRRDGTIGDDAFHRVEEEFDLAELSARTPTSR
jgi:monovalent cation/hydrogen antiporter